MILSGYDHFQYAQTAVRYGVDDYLLKPIDMENLEKAFARIVHKLEDIPASQKECPNVKPLSLPE